MIKFDYKSSTFILRMGMIVVLLMHSVSSIVTNDVSQFGRLYLDQVGFAPFGLYLAWLIKLSHVGTAVCLLFEKFVKTASLVTIVILVAGIIMVHAPNGWFVVGGGRNGVEFNVILIVILVHLMFPNGFKINKTT